jgi:hypothetical protein
VRHYLAMHEGKLPKTLEKITDVPGLEKEIAEADPTGLSGKPLPPGKIAIASGGSAGVVASACMEEKIVGTREAPTVAARDRQSNSGDGLAWAACGTAWNLDNGANEVRGKYKVGKIHEVEMSAAGEIIETN